MTASADRPAADRLRLRYAPTSPFVRKVLVVARELGVEDRLELVLADVWSPETDIAADNPLGKVPALATPDGVVVGSTLICSYLETLADGRSVLPADPAARWQALRLHAVAEGIMDAALAFTMERIRRPEDKVWQGWLDRQEGKVRAALEYLAASPASARAGVDLYTITLACALAYLDLRMPHVDWRGLHPGLAEFEAGFAERRSLRETRPEALSRAAA